MPDSRSINETVSQGAQAVIRRSPGQPGYLIKAYKDPSTVDFVRLQAHIDWVTTLPTADRQFLQEHMAWPLELSSGARHGTNAGFVMQEAPGDAFCISSTGRRHLLESDSLMTLPRPATRDWMPEPTAEQRLNLVIDFAETMAWLDKHTIVFGDISHRNVIWRRHTGQVFLVDCDQARFEGHAPPSDQSDTPGFKDPASIGRLDPRQRSLDSDRYKTAVWIGRVLARSLHEMPSHQPSEDFVFELERTIRDSNRELYVNRILKLWAQARVGGARPHAQEWVQALRNIREFRPLISETPRQWRRPSS